MDSEEDIYVVLIFCLQIKNEDELQWTVHNL
jgi:hypothetical protein